MGNLIKIIRKCPRCKSCDNLQTYDFYKYRYKDNSYIEIPRFKCKKCGYIFSNRHFSYFYKSHLSQDIIIDIFYFRIFGAKSFSYIANALKIRKDTARIIFLKGIKNANKLKIHLSTLGNKRAKFTYLFLQYLKTHNKYAPLTEYDKIKNKIIKSLNRHKGKPVPELITGISALNSGPDYDNNT